MLPAHEEVALLEEEIEALADRIAGCRKLAAGAKALIASGFAALLLLLAGVLGRSPIALVFGVSAVLGGFTLPGSNRRTMDDLSERGLALASKRDALIADLDLRAMSN
jgi:hypothetical protein